MRRLLPVLAWLTLSGCAPGDRPPDLLLVTVDTLRADRLTCYGGASGAGLCALFEDGTRFRWAFSTAAATAPSIASLLTSRYPASHGVAQPLRFRLADGATSVAEVLRASGYDTAAFVSNPVLGRARNLGQGFAVYDDRMTRRERNRPGFAERDAAATTDAALAWVQQVASEPWFLWVHYQDPHGPYDPPGATPAHDEASAERLPLLRDDSGRSGIPAYQALPGLFSAAAYEARHRDEIDHLENHLLRLVRALDARGRRPALLLTADHGEAFGEDDYWFAHGHSLGLDQIRVPLLLRRAPGQPAGPRVVQTPVSGIDVAPTLLALAGVAAPAEFAGCALPCVASGDGPTRALFADHPRHAAVIRGDRYYAQPRSDDVAGGGASARFAARTATLGADDALPPYRAARDDEEARDLAARLAARLAATPAFPAARRPPEATAGRAALRALGYGADGTPTPARARPMAAPTPFR